MINIIFVLTLNLLSFAFPVQDQFDNPWPADQSQLKILFAADMDGYRMLNRHLTQLKDPRSIMETHHIAYVADISQMPAIISKMIAIPKMKKLSYSIFLDKSGEVTKDWHKTAKGVTVFSVGADKKMKVIFELIQDDQVEAFLNDLAKTK